jgi:hypothetical protein
MARKSALFFSELRVCRKERKALFWAQICGKVRSVGEPPMQYDSLSVNEGNRAVFCSVLRPTFIVAA